MNSERLKKSGRVRRVLVKTLESGYVIRSHEVVQLYVDNGLTKAAADGWKIDGFRNMKRTCGVPVNRVKLGSGYGFYDARFALEETDYQEVVGEKIR